MDSDLDSELTVLEIHDISREHIPKVRGFLNSWLNKEIIGYSFIPLESYIILEIIGLSSDSINDLVDIIFALAPWLSQKYKLQKEKYADNSFNSFSLLPYEVLRDIFKRCTLKEQIALMKVCRKFYFIIKDIWKLQGKTLYYCLKTFLVTHQLSVNELEDYLIVNGCEINTLLFMAYTVDGISIYSNTEDGNQMTIFRKHLNQKFCNNLKYLPNLKEFYGEGPLLDEDICLSLGKYCKKLTTFKYFHINDMNFTGKNFYFLDQLEKLALRGLQKLEYNNLKLINLKKLKSLNITKCEPGLNARLIDKLCSNLVQLETFKLSALHGEDMLVSILQLPRLKKLQFNAYKASFISVLFRKIDAYRTLDLHSLKFGYTKWEIDRKIKPHKKKWLKAYIARKKAPKIIVEDTIFEEILKYLKHLKYLEEIRFEYNIVFNGDQLESIISELPNLRKIIFKECRIVEEARIIELMEKSYITNKCLFYVDDVDTDIMRKHSAWLNSKSLTVLTPYTCIECYFYQNNDFRAKERV